LGIDTLYALQMDELMQLCDEFEYHPFLRRFYFTELAHDLIEWCYLQGQISHFKSRIWEIYNYDRESAASL
jgi:hypothetical protein